MKSGNGRPQRAESAADAAAPQAANLTEWHPYCTAACTGKYEHTETLWLYVDRGSENEQKLAAGIQAGVAATVARQFGCDYVDHQIIPDKLVRPHDGRNLTTTMLEVDAVDRIADGLTAVMGELVADATLPDTARDEDMIGIRVTFACPFKINALRGFYLGLYPEDAARIGMRVSGDSE